MSTPCAKTSPATAPPSSREVSQTRHRTTWLRRFPRNGSPRIDGSVTLQTYFERALHKERGRAPCHPAHGLDRQTSPDGHGGTTFVQSRLTSRHAATSDPTGVLHDDTATDHYRHVSRGETPCDLNMHFNDLTHRDMHRDWASWSAVTISRAPCK